MPVSEIGLVHGDDRYRFTIENAYLATELIAFWSLYQATETSVYIDRIRSRIRGKQQANGCYKQTAGKRLQTE